MSQGDLAALIGAVLGGAIGVVLLACVAVIVLFWPILAWSAVRNLKLMRVQLERLNDTLERRPSPLHADRPPTTVAREPEVGPWQHNKAALPRI